MSPDDDGAPKPPSIPEEIFEAIETRREVKLDYEQDGSAGGTRTAQPHAVYRGGDGRLLVFAFQTHGPSESGTVPGWRRFAVESLRDINLTETEFQTREEYDPSSREYSPGLIASVY